MGGVRRNDTRMSPRTLSLKLMKIAAITKTILSVRHVTRAWTSPNTLNAPYR